MQNTQKMYKKNKTSRMRKTRKTPGAQNSIPLIPSVLSAIKPTPSELELELDFSRSLVAHVKKNVSADCEVVLTGSMAKRTFLRDKKDVDVFVLFPPSFPRSELEPAIKRIMKSAFPKINYQLSYAEHPYVRFHLERRRIDLVPAYKISDASERISSVDRSVLHTKFVLDSLKKNQVDDVLLLKQFLRANDLYGAEIKIEGFSGYLCELLVIAYGGFMPFVRAAARWKSPIFLDIKKYYGGKKQIESKQTESALKPVLKSALKPALKLALKSALNRFDSPFVVVDPVDKNRNVAAAVSGQNFSKFVSLCKKFIKKPSKDLFFRKPETFEDKVAKKAKKNPRIYLLSMPRPDIVDDVLWGQLHKLIHQLKVYLKDLDFELKDILADDSKHLVRFAFVFGADRLPDKMLVIGPPTSMKRNVLEFKKSHKKAKFVVKNKKVCAEVNRPVKKAESAIRMFFRTFAATNKSHLAYPEEMLILEKWGKN